MGIDLEIIIDKWDLDEWVTGSNAIYLDRDHTMHGAIKKLPLINETRKVFLYSDEGLETRTEDCYGSPLQWVYAPQLAKVMLSSNCPFNVAVAQMLKNLAPDTKILLNWR